MPEIPAEAVRAALAAIERELVSRPFDPFFKGDEALARAAVEAAAPHLGLPARKPRMVCPVCTRDVVRRDDGTPTQHYPHSSDPALTCGGQMYSYCKGGCRCRKGHK